MFDVAELLDRRAQEFGDRVMMRIAGTAVTFAQMRDRSSAAANVLAEMGVTQGETVALFTATCPEWVYFWLGAAHIGAVTAAINAANKDTFLLHALRLSQTKVVLTDHERQPRLDEVADDVPSLKRTLLHGDSLTDRLMSAPTTTQRRRARDDDIGALFFTSGTTGPSKAVATTWPYLLNAAASVASAWEVGDSDVVWTAMPLFHLSAAPSVLVPLLTGSTTVLASGFHPTKVWDEIRDCQATGFAGAGAMVSMLWNLPDDPRDADVPLRFISAAPISPDLYRGIERRYRCRVVTMYGMTEAFPIAYKAVSAHGMPGTSGRLSPSFDVRILGEHANPLGTNQVGEITCRSRTAHTMSMGYVSPASDGLHVDPHPEWFRTGDLGYLDDDQNLTFVDRAKDALRRRGENVSSVEVEATVMKHPAVQEAAAVGIPSDLGEDDIMVVVTLRPGQTTDYTELLDFCSQRMPYFCVPRYLEVLDEIPKNVMGRVRKDVLRTRGRSPHTWDREAHGYVVSR
jgi:crotonobetaine/carnitine-CoA ligase